jgi:hypothetical protein
MTVVLLGGLCGVSSFANNIIVGAKNLCDCTLDGSQSNLEGLGDFQDLMVQLSAPGLEVASNGTWSPFSSSIVNQNGPSTTNPFWDNQSYDTAGAAPVGAPKNIGYCLTTTNCSTIAPNLSALTPPTQYLTQTGNLGADVTDFYFTFTPGSVETVLLGGLTNVAGNTQESLGIYEAAPTLALGGSSIDWLITDGAINTSFVSGGTFTVPTGWTGFGLIFEVGADTFFYSQNSIGAFVNGTATDGTLTGDGSGVSVPNRFALFQSVSPTSGVPEPGTMALFGIGALALGLIPRLRKRR